MAIKNQHDEIIQYLEYIKSQNRSVTIVRSFKGVSFSIEASIIQINERKDEIIIRSRHQEKLPLLLKTQVFLHSLLLPRPIQANVCDVESNRFSATLNQLDYYQKIGENREYPRILPEIGLSTTIFLERGGQLVAEIMDISVGGLSVIVKEMTEENKSWLLPHTPVQLTLALPLLETKPAELTLEAHVTYIRKMSENGSYRVGFKFLTDDLEKNTLRRYIFDRQTQIFSEIKSK
jgi:hypothetical protein